MIRILESQISEIWIISTIICIMYIEHMIYSKNWKWNLDFCCYVSCVAQTYISEYDFSDDYCLMLYSD